MTVSTTLNKQIFPGNAATTVFNFSFAFPGGLAAQEAANIQVFYTSPAGVITQLVQGITSSNYQITFNNPITPDPTPVGGTVIYSPPGGPIPFGSFLTIYRNLPLVQGFSFANQGILYQPTIEAALDYQAMLSQQVLEVQSRALVVPISDPTPSPLPSATARAGLFLAFDSNGNPIASAGGGGGGGGGVSSFNGRVGAVFPQSGDYTFSLLGGNISVSQMNSGSGAAGNTFWGGSGAWAQVNFNQLAGNISVSQMNAGSGASSSTVWYGDGTWKPVGGGGLWPPAQRSVTTTPSIVSGDVILNCSFSTTTTIALPQASTRAGKPLTFVCLNAGSHAVTLAPFSGDTIVNWTTPSSMVINANGVVVTIFPFNDSVNTGWFIA